jgi:hypothetical protein
LPNFIRAYRLVVGGIDIDARAGVGPNALRIAFNVERDHERAPNNAEVAVWNLSRGQREALAKLDVVPVRIEAGYADDVGLIFQGDLRSARSRHEGPDYITRVSAGDGESKIRTARISRTFARGTPVGDVIGQLGKALGVSPGNLSQFRGAQLANGSRTLMRALTISGAASDELERLCRSCGLDWSVQSGVLQIRETGRPVGTEQGPLLRADSGLIGDTETERATKTEGGVVKGQQVVSGVCLMRSDLVPGRSFRTESANGGYSGNLVCTKTVHEGDSNSDQPWYVSWSGVPYG